MSEYDGIRERKQEKGGVAMLLGASVLVLAGFGAGLLAGQTSAFQGAIPTQAAAVLGITIQQQPEGVDFAPVWKAWKVIDEKFVPAAVASTTPVASTTEARNQERVWGMIQGLAGSLNDPYTFFLPPAEQEIFEDDISGAFEGVGMEIALRDTIITVVSPLKGTPAERAGIKAGDRVIEIDGTATKGMDVSRAVQLIRGPKGTEVVFSIVREGAGEPLEIKVVRDVINLPTVETEELEGGIFVIRVFNFSANAPMLFRDALRDFVESGRSKLIIDLRGNPGGYLDAAVDMASWFLPAGRVVVTEDYGGNARNVVHRSRGYNIFNDNLKVVILMDRGSASASEILIDALNHWKRFDTVGTKSFGKGSVQELVEITEDTALKITVARWVGPDGEQIPNDGLEPDYLVEMPEDEEDDSDPQLAKAIELLNK